MHPSSHHDNAKYAPRDCYLVSLCFSCFVFVPLSVKTERAMRIGGGTLCGLLGSILLQVSVFWSEVLNFFFFSNFEKKKTKSTQMDLKDFVKRKSNLSRPKS